MMFLTLTLRHPEFMSCLLNHQRLKYVNDHVSVIYIPFFWKLEIHG